ncbi:TOBE domain-containing protein [Desulfonatronovibrio hydrogenovorans]|uniref:TOBE domain-containing protein n=1 Tax=Desulfonatronovibrio hydrogenovorans TaxID=53245 RepID=UPI00055102D7|nr:TOBE domain-containing protein [Desulfonatronovibrio hydrogenovorans]
MPKIDIFSLTPGAKVLDPVQMAEMERSFRSWAADSPRQDVIRSRQRILHIFLLIRHTGAKLHEVLSLRPSDISLKDRIIRFGARGTERFRSVEIPNDLARDLESFLSQHLLSKDEALFRIDPAHVRKKFYERAKECGLPKDFGNPSTLRRSRTVELMRGNLPLPIVQKLLGRTSSNPAEDLVEFSDEDLHYLVRQHIDLEATRRTSARNTFFGKIIRIEKGDIQSLIVLLTLGGIRLYSVITNGSLERMRLKTGTLTTAEIKAPSVFIGNSRTNQQISAENRLRGRVESIVPGKVNSEVLLSLEDGTKLCAVVTSKSLTRLGLKVMDPAWAMFGAYSVVLNYQ